VSVAANDDYLMTEGSNQFQLSLEGNSQIPTTNGNLDTIAPSPPSQE
jgi:hypothetical protein